MSEGDFTQVADDAERVDEIARAAIAAMPDTTAKARNDAYSMAIGEAGDAYIKSVAFEGEHNLPAKFRWHEIWDAMNEAKETPHD